MEQNYKIKEIEARFREKFFIRDDCWIWKTKSCLFYVNPTLKKLGHYFSYEFYVGKRIQYWVLFRICGNRSCVNPKHLAQESRKDYNKRINYKCFTAKLTHCRKCGNLLEYVKRKGTIRGCALCEKKAARVRDARRRKRLKSLSL